MTVKRNNRGLLSIVAATTLLLVLLWNVQLQSVQAQSNSANGKCRPIDIVILLDQSESMYGSAANNLSGNDIEGQRFIASGTIVDYLANHAIWLCSEEGIQHRIAVVGFGDLAASSQNGPDNPYIEDTKIYLEPTSIPAGNPAGKDQSQVLEEWKQQRENIIASIDAGQGDNLGATDHRSAFMVAKDILAEWQEDSLGDQPRRQAVIMLTDGEPCVANRGCPPQTYSLTMELMNELQEMTSSTGDDFPFFGAENPESVYISALLLSRRPDGDVSWDKWEEITQIHGGDIYTTTNSALLTKEINDALDPITGSGREPLDCGEPKWVQPYLDNVIVFYAFPTQAEPAGAAVITIDADNEQYGIQGGTPITGNLTIDDYLTFRGNERYVFNSPIPGLYRVFVPNLSDCTDELSLKVESAPVSGEVIEPKPDSIFPAAVDPPYYSDALHSRFVLEMRDKNGQPLQEIAGYPLAVQAVVQHGSDEKTYTLEKVPGEDGRYESAIIETPLPGKYTWELSATVRSPNPEEGSIEIFKDNGSFEASPVELLIFTIDTPADGYTGAINRVDGTSRIPEPLDIAVTVINADGDDVDVTQILEDWDSLFTAQLSDGANIFETISLQLDPTSKNHFTGQFSNGSVDNVYESGTHIVQVTADWGGKDNYDELTYAPALNEASVTIEQYEIVPLQLEMILPDSAPLHKRENPLTMLLKQNGLQPFDLSVRVVASESGEPQRLEDVLTDLNGFDVAVQTPSGITQTINLVESGNVAEQLLIGRGGETLDESGEYIFSMLVTDDQLATGYAWAQKSYEAPLPREDTLYTKPSTWTGAQITLLIILIIIIGLLIRAFSGGPTGVLIVSDSDGEAIIELSLRKRRRVNKFKRSVLREAGIKRIVARKGFGNLLSISVEGMDGFKTELDMEPGDLNIVGDAEIKYVNDRAVTSYDDDFDLE